MNRRRDQALLVQKVTGWKLRQRFKEDKKVKSKRCNNTLTLRDVANAFPSPSHEKMDEMIDRKYGGRMAAFLKARYRKSWVIITIRAGQQLVIRPRCGGLQ